MAEWSKESIIKAIYHYSPQAVIILGILLAAAGAAYVFLPSSSSSQVEIIKADEQEETGVLIADISGAVIQPGVYTLSAGSRLNDLLIAAGGLSIEADRDWVEKNINRAAPLIDGAKIYIPKIGEEVGPPAGGVAGQSTSGLINLNQADLALLETLPGIGPATAQKILDYRKEIGSFSAPEELMSVSGIGPKTYEQLKDLISVY
ncbi:MAG: helix-hairpin-helix domain-containing protein [Candidatus Shapirobacteria bacterium]